LGDEADHARARQQAEYAAELDQRRENWSAIDSLVKEFIPEAVARNAPKARGVFVNRRYWQVRSAQSERDYLVIWQNGKWELRRDSSADSYQSLAWWRDPDKGPRGANPVDGLREGAMRLLNG
jgi:hypothetical protein